MEWLALDQMAELEREPGCPGLQVLSCPLTSSQVTGSFFLQLHSFTHVRGHRRIYDHLPFSACKETSWIKNKPPETQAKKQTTPQIMRPELCSYEYPHQCLICSTRHLLTAALRPHPHPCCVRTRAEKHPEWQPAPAPNRSFGLAPRQTPRPQSGTEETTVLL